MVYLFYRLDTINMILIIINNKVINAIKVLYILKLFKIEWAAFREELLEMSKLNRDAFFLLFTYHIFNEHLKTLARYVVKGFHTGV